MSKKEDKEKKVEDPRIKELYELLAPNKHKVFFAATGLTTTEASHKADLIKETAVAIGDQFTQTGAYHGVLDFAGKAVSVDNFNKIDLEALSTREGELYALSAWLREAVSAKDKLLRQFKDINIAEFTPERSFPQFEEERPSADGITRPNVITEDDIIGEFSIAERAEYLTVEAKAAHLGKKIHPKGVIFKLKADLQKGKLTTYKELPSGHGSATYLIEYDPLYNKEDVEGIYFRLQDTHRAHESRLNYFKARIKNGVTEQNAKLNQEYADAVRKESAEYDILSNAWNTKFRAFNQEQYAYKVELEKLRLEVIKYISQLKVIVPSDLKHILDEIAEKSA